MRASLIWPQFTGFSELDESWLPHGVTQLATEANAKGHEVDILDGRVLGAQGMKNALKETTSEVVGISILSSLMGNAEEIFDYLRKNRPDIKTIIGGIHPTVSPSDFASWDADWILTGEGEVTFPRILDGSVETGWIEGERPDLALLNPPDRSLTSIPERPLPGLEEPFGTVIIGRGCPYNCNFCQPAERKLFGQKVRYRPAEKVVEEITGLEVKSFMIHDDCFTAKTSYVEEFLEALPDGLTWWCQGRADNVVDNMDLVKEMRDKGLRGMILGHESGDQRVLDSLQKGTTVGQNVEASAFLKALGVIVWSNIMLGTPDEPPSAVINTIIMVDAMRPNCLSTSVFTPHPGSALYDRCMEEKRILRRPGDWTYYNRGKFDAKIAGPDYGFLRWAADTMYKSCYQGGQE